MLFPMATAVRLPKAFLALVVAALAALLATSLIPTAARAATTQTASCVDGGGVRWYAKAIWGGTYTAADGTQKISIDYAGWTTKAGKRPTDSIVRSYDGSGRLLQTLSWTGVFDYRSGSAYKVRNPLNPPSSPGRAYVRVTLGVDGDGFGPCTVTFTWAVGAVESPPPANSHLVPATIASDCSADATAALLKWIVSIPDNSILSFAPAKCYRIDGTLELRNRIGLTFQGNGATFRSFTPMVTGNVADDQRAMFRVIASSAISFENMAIVGSYTHGGTLDKSLQHAHAIDLRGTSAVVANVTMSNVAGDCVYFGLGYDNVTKSSGSAHDSTCTSIGRNGISVTAGQGITVKRMTLDKVGYIAFDVEPNVGQGWGASTVLFDSNAIKSYYLYAFSVVENAPINDITFTNNRVIGQGLRAAISNPSNRSFRPQNVALIGNSSDTRQPAAAFNVDNVDVLSITGNTVPLTSGTMAYVDRSCKINVSNNIFTGGTRQVVTSNPATTC
jgi:hypothetical protein